MLHLEGPQVGVDLLCVVVAQLRVADAERVEVEAHRLHRHGLPAAGLLGLLLLFQLLLKLLLLPLTRRALPRHAHVGGLRHGRDASRALREHSAETADPESVREQVRWKGRKSERPKARGVAPSVAEMVPPPPRQAHVRASLAGRMRAGGERVAAAGSPSRSSPHSSRPCW